MNKIELGHRLAHEGFRDDVYSLDGGMPALLEGYILRRLGNRWAIEYTERGDARVLAEYVNEDQACSALYDMLNADPTTRR